MSPPIPARLFPEFRDVMSAANDEDAPDGAWFAMLEDTAREFMRQRKLRGCPNDATHQYLRELAWANFDRVRY